MKNFRGNEVENCTSNARHVFMDPRQRVFNLKLELKLFLKRKNSQKHSYINTITLSISFMDFVFLN